jgi:hypothetical protein
MVATFPSNAGGIGGRGRSATKEDLRFMTEFTTNYNHGGTNILAAGLLPNNQINQIARSSNISRSGSRKQTRMRYQAYLHEPRVGPSVHGSPWIEDQALRSFQGQYRQFDQGLHDRPNFPGHIGHQVTQCHPHSHNRTSILRASRYAESTMTMTRDFD